MNEHLNENHKAFKFIEFYHIAEKFNYNVSTKLLSYLQERNNIDKMIKVSNKIIENLDKEKDSLKINKINDLILSLYGTIDVNKAIEFLENNSHNDYKLLELYMITAQDEKALVFANALYKKTNDDKILGNIAILEYEKNRKDIKNVIEKFEKSLAIESNDKYENYYGYILIDDNIDAKKGISLIKKALKKYPDNYAYKDSLAYGYYIDKQCKKAYELMSEIVNKVGLDNQDIKEHWNKIQNCKENK